MQAQAFTSHYKFISNGRNGFSKPIEEKMLQLGSEMITSANVLPTTESTDVKMFVLKILSKSDFAENHILQGMSRHRAKLQTFQAEE